MTDIVSNGLELGWGILVHGGAGHIASERRGVHEAGCKEAARAGFAVLEAGGSALDAVQAASRVLEDLPQFNAGTGACLNEHGEVEHDASIMEGERLRAGAVCAVRGIKNPIELARRVLDDGRHVLLAGDGARAFAESVGIAPVDEATLVTDEAVKALDRYRAGRAPSGWAGGTIGAVALDAKGHVAAATSTGGVIGKRRGRVGDSPILGAGTFADDTAGAISATGDGEAVLRLGLAHRIGARLRAGEPAETVCREEMSTLADLLGGHGGVIVITKRGALAWARSTETMSYAWISDRGEGSGT
ncbi:MAG: isoaspartyl peptidase/L-asparaginase [Polyangiaceae bacterium]